MTTRVSRCTRQRTVERDHRLTARALLVGLAGALGTALIARAGSHAPLRAPKPTRLDALEVRAAHPRIWIDDAKLAWLREKVRGRSKEEVAELAGGSLPGMALAGLLTNDAALCRSAFERHVGKRTGEGRLYHLALLYDWCHAHLTAAEKTKVTSILVSQMERDMQNGRLWRSFHNAGHTHAMTLTLAALALYGDHPFGDRALAFLRPELEDILLTFDEVFPDGAWAEGADYARHASHHGLRTFLALKSATGTDLIAQSPHLRNVATFVFYATKPNGLMWNGDDNDYPYLSAWEHRALLMHAAEYRDPHAQWFLNHVDVERFELEEKDRWEHLLWYDASIPEKPLDDLPLARNFRGKGLVLARSAWNDPNATWIAFTNGDYFGDHVHYDVNAFQIHHKGALAIDSGRYDDDWDAAGKADQIARSQLFNYYQRTIAHNTMLVFDPNEQGWGHGLLNDGGQRHLIWKNGARNVPEDYAQGTFPSDDGIGTCDWKTNPGRWDRGDITAYETTPDFVFVRGDGTKAYAPEKLSRFVRELVWVRPNIVVVFDRVVAKHERTWLLHSVNEPRLDANGFEIEEGEGRLANVVLLPKTRRLDKVGGPGNEHLVGNVRFKAGPQSELNPSPLHYGEIPGAWRVELASNEDYFANVMLLTDRASSERPEIEELVDDDTQLRFRVRAGATSAGLHFTKGEKPHTTLKIDRGSATTFDRALRDSVDIAEACP